MTDLPDSTRWQLWIVAFGFFMQSLDTTIVNTALPSMAQSLGESPLHMHMVIVSYVLTVAVMLPASGWLADKVGVRNIFFTAIVLFTLGSLFCALSGTLNELLLARALQGRRQGSHHNRAKTQQTGLENSFLRRQVTVPLGFKRKIDHHNGVFLHDAD